MKSCVWDGEPKDMSTKKMMPAKVLCQSFKIHFLVKVEARSVRVFDFQSIE